MPSLRCSGCGTNWPPQNGKFDRCPECGERCWWSGNDPIDSSELAHRMFEVFYAKREAERIKAEREVGALVDELEIAVELEATD